MVEAFYFNVEFLYNVFHLRVSLRELNLPVDFCYLIFKYNSYSKTAYN